MRTLRTLQHRVADIDLGPAPDDPWAEVDVTFTGPDGTSRSVPAFISRSRWRVRYSSGLVGIHHWSTELASGAVEVEENTGSTKRLDKGPLVVAEGGTSFAHANGEPFLWLGDTWWHGFVSAKVSDREFADLAAQRNEQGFTVVQIVAGLPCEVQPFDEANRARSGFAWEPAFTQINTAWWDDADDRIATLVDNDLLPCILGSWGYHFSLLTPEQFRRHWREILARWAAYPVVWCLAGEPTLPNYDQVKEIFATVIAEAKERKQQVGASEAGQSEWAPQDVFHGPAMTALIAPQVEHHNQLLRHVKDVDPFDRLMTTHMIPGWPSWEFLDDESLVDFWMLQTGHSGFNSLVPTHDMLLQAVTREPRKPVVNGEVNYEGIADTSGPDIQRFLFWTQMLAGAAGFTYGAHGIWAFNTDEFPKQHSGLAPHWKEAAQFPGGAQVGNGRKMLDGYPWAQGRPAPHLVEPHARPDYPVGPRAIELADGRRLIYVPSFGFQRRWSNPTYLELGDHPWRVDYIDLKTGETHSSDEIRPDSTGAATVTRDIAWALPSWGDWLVTLTPLQS